MLIDLAIGAPPLAPRIRGTHSILHHLCPTPASKESMGLWNVWLHLLRTHVFLLNHCPGTPSLKSLTASRPLAGLYEALSRRLDSERRTTLQVYVLFSSRGRKRGLLSGIGLLCVDLGLHGWGSLSAGVPTRLLLRQGGARRQREGTRPQLLLLLHAL